MSSFLQRLGRSGRRGQPSEMLVVCEESRDPAAPFPDQIPWSLLQAIAIIQLYVEEQWIEPISRISFPFSLLYQQTMSTLATGELSPPALAQRVLTLPPFAAITSDDYRVFLRHLLSIGHIQHTEEGGLIIGLAGERVVRDFRFYAVFADNPELTVLEDSRQIGTITDAPMPGDRIALAGRTWEVLSLDAKRMQVFVKRVQGRAQTRWTGGGGSIHTRILQRMRQVLLEDTVYAYLQPTAVDRLSDARHLARQARVGHESVVQLADQAFCIFPWMGSIATRTLERVLRYSHSADLNITGMSGRPPYFLVIRTSNATPDSVRRALADAMSLPIRAETLVGPDDAPRLDKYDEFVPDELLRKAFAADRLDVSEMKSCLQSRAAHHS